MALPAIELYKIGETYFVKDGNHRVSVAREHGQRFIDVSEHAGIYGGVEGYGLGVVASDLNLDGCTDLFIANDFQENDFLYVNNCDGTFTESIGRAMAHTSRFSMGVDAADFNNDLRLDLVTANYAASSVSAGLRASPEAIPTSPATVVRKPPSGLAWWNHQTRAMTPGSANPTPVASATATARTPRRSRPHPA